MKGNSYVSYGSGTIFCIIEWPKAYFKFSFAVAYYMIGHWSTELGTGGPNGKHS